MIELKDGDVLFVAVGAGELLEHRPYEREVASDDVRTSQWVGPVSTCGGAPPVAVDANDLASDDLLIEPRRLDPESHESPHVGHLRPDVVELQDHRIWFAAITARMTFEVVEDVPLSPQLTLSLRSLRLPAVDVAAL